MSVICFQVWPRHTKSDLTHDSLRFPENEFIKQLTLSCWYSFFQMTNHVVLDLGPGASLRCRALNTCTIPLSMGASSDPCVPSVRNIDGDSAHAWATGDNIAYALRFLLCCSNKSISVHHETHPGRWFRSRFSNYGRRMGGPWVSSMKIACTPGECLHLAMCFSILCLHNIFVHLHSWWCVQVVDFES